MPIRLIGIDIDGTLLDSQWQIPEANQRAIAAAVERGIEVALVTGRRFDFALPIANRVPLPLTLMVNNGALIKSKSGETFLRRLLDRNAARHVLEATPDFRVGATVVFDRPRENQIIFEAMDWEHPARKSYWERNRDFIGEASPLESCLTENPIQVMFTGPVARMRDVAERLRGLDGSPGFSIALTEYQSRDFSLVDVLHPDVSKGRALKDWAARRGFPRESVMAIGDNLNDQEMLEFAGVAVIMGNSVEQIRQPGWHVTSSNDEAGVAKAIQELALASR